MAARRGDGDEEIEMGERKQEPSQSDMDWAKAAVRRVFQREALKAAAALTAEAAKLSPPARTGAEAAWRERLARSRARGG